MRVDRRELVTAALLGTDRRPAAGPGPDPALALLDEAARSSLATRAGAVLPRPPAPEPGPAAHPVWAPAPAQAIAGRLLVRPEAALVNLWLTAAAAHGQGLAPWHWPGLAAYASRSAEVDRSRLASVLGGSGRWFVAQNPQWAKLAAELARPPVRAPAADPPPGVEPDQLQQQPELILAVPDPWPRRLVEVALMVVGTGRLQWRAAAYATALGVRLPPDLFPLVRSAAAFYAPPDAPLTSRIVRDAFAVLDRTLYLRVEIEQALGATLSPPDPQENP